MTREELTMAIVKYKHGGESIDYVFECIKENVEAAYVQGWYDREDDGDNEMQPKGDAYYNKTLGKPDTSLSQYKRK